MENWKRFEKGFFIENKLRIKVNLNFLDQVLLIVFKKAKKKPQPNL